MLLMVTRLTLLPLNSLHILLIEVHLRLQLLLQMAVRILILRVHNIPTQDRAGLLPFLPFLVLRLLFLNIILMEILIEVRKANFIEECKAVLLLKAILTLRQQQKVVKFLLK